MPSAGPIFTSPQPSTTPLSSLIQNNLIDFLGCLKLQKCSVILISSRSHCGLCGLHLKQTNIFPTYSCHVISCCIRLILFLAFITLWTYFKFDVCVNEEDEATEENNNVAVACRLYHVSELIRTEIKRFNIIVSGSASLFCTLLYYVTRATSFKSIKLIFGSFNLK